MIQRFTEKPPALGTIHLQVYRKLEQVELGIRLPCSKSVVKGPLPTASCVTTTAFISDLSSVHFHHSFHSFRQLTETAGVTCASRKPPRTGDSGVAWTHGQSS
ncbi:hypothetical protein TGRUB_360100 [Toxoplasma gondii RUB]|uniref:Uncharacterized protein n=3 Tax=Toxoplasma gondii TaxID=5811 RepID=A0A086M054_TOXGO|nr:hypothetical protein TGP89_360100 [Toxoplasma gondii p89]KFG62272.1 hypothetical protein TGRUB_360100 [Toxoplasma gondii RUB]RQX69999.1 hypothetical protein TGCAST_360100 [Toxoplasma gondii CAST]